MSETILRRTEITFETYSRTVIKTRGGRIETTFCDACGRNAPILTMTDAASVFGASAEFVEILLNSEHIHAAAENKICAVSLANYLGKTTALAAVKHEGEGKC